MEDGQLMYLDDLNEHSLTVMNNAFPHSVRKVCDDHEVGGGGGSDSDRAGSGVHILSRDIAGMTPLFLHQTTDIAAMRVLESESVKCPLPSHMFSSQYRYSSMTTDIGILADPPGSGKGFTVLSHVASRPRVRKNCASSIEKQISSSIYHESVHLKFVTKPFRVIDTNIFIVPRSTLAQWLTYAKTLARIPEEHIGCAKIPSHVKTEFVNDVESGKYMCVFFTESSYSEFLKKGASSDVMYQRLIIDEADSIGVVGFRFVNALFTWFVTANHHIMLKEQAKLKRIRTLFRDNFDRNFRVFQDIDKMLVVRSNDAFVQKSLMLLPVSVRTILTRTSRLFESVREHVPQAVMNAVYACDMASAISMLGCSTTTTEEGMISAITEQYHHEIQMLNHALRTASLSSVETLRDRISEIDRKIENIKDRVRQVECCPISLEEIRCKAVTPCCHNGFEFLCLLHALHRAPRCPICKRDLRPDDVVVKTDMDHTANDEAGSLNEGDGRVRFRNKAAALKFEFSSIFSDSSSRTLIFSRYDMYNLIGQIRFIAGHSMQELKGSISRIEKLLADFRRGCIRVLLLNPDHFGAGINLECATHIITLHEMPSHRYQQLIGRAQRPGRTCQLSLINIRFENET